MPRITGSGGSNQIKGSSSGDSVYGFGGNDNINSGFGNDRVFAGSGNDTINGFAGNDRIHGDSGNDKLLGSDGKDTIFGGTGEDNINGGAKVDMLMGEEGNDKIYGSSGNDSLYGGEGADSLDGGLGNDWLVGGTGDDAYNDRYVQAGNDFIFDNGGTGDTLNLAEFKISEVTISYADEYTITASNQLNYTQDGNIDTLYIETDEGYIGILGYFDNSGFYSAGYGLIENIQFLDENTTDGVDAIYSFSEIVNILSA